MRTALVYMGKRGAGVEFTSQLTNFLRIDALVVSNKLSDEKIKKFENKFVLRRMIFSYPILYLFDFSWTNKVETFLKDEKIEKLIFPMFTPLDYVLFKRIQYKFKTISIIHDSSRHPGDYWPLDRAIKRIYLASTQVICLSKYTKTELVRKYGLKNNISVFPHPLMFSKLLSNNTNSLTDGVYVLIIGRIRKYKGIENFLENWLQGFNFQIKLVIAGEGKPRCKIPKNSNIKLISRWLSENEIQGLIRSSAGVIFPYIEASQSGLLPVAISYNKWILVSDVGGLKEQSEKYPNTVIYKPFEIETQELSINQFIQNIISGNSRTTQIESNSWQDFSSNLGNLPLD